jgi:hypothetical protein
MLVFRLQIAKQPGYYSTRETPPYYNPLIISFTFYSYFLAVRIRLENRRESSLSGRDNELRKDRRISSLRSERRNRFAPPPQNPSSSPQPPVPQTSCSRKEGLNIGTAKRMFAERREKAVFSGTNGLLGVAGWHTSWGIPYRPRKRRILWSFEGAFLAG